MYPSILCQLTSFKIAYFLNTLLSPLSKKRLHEFLWAYSRSHRYLAAIALRIPRIDLDGSQICLITDRDVEYAHEIGREKFANWDDILAVEARYRNDIFSQAAE